MSEKFVVFKSSAGSGKTFTLALTYLKIALSKSTPDQFRQVLAITFTVKAAAEMKERIIRFLSGISNQRESDEIKTVVRILCEETGLNSEELHQKSSALLESILHNYEQFAVMTIDKFVNRLVRSFASDLGFTNDFEIELDTQRIADQTVDQLLTELESNQKLSQMLIEFLEHQVSNDLSWRLENQLSSLTTKLSTEEFYLKSKAIEHLSLDDFSRIQNDMSKKVRSYKSQVQKLGNETLELIAKRGLSMDDFYRKKTGIYSYFKAASQFDLNRLIHPNSYVQQTINDGKWYTGDSHGGIDAILPDLEQKLSEILELAGKGPRIKLMMSVGSSLYSLAVIHELRRCFEAVKEDENVQLLSDFYQTITERILEERAPFIYERIGNRFKHILIDEFQDTSLLQWKCFQPLIENTLAENNLNIIVGDEKQSIYRFRGGEPALFQSMNEEESDIPSFLKPHLSVNRLDTNYRSNETIVAFNNSFFEQLADQFLLENQKSVYGTLKQNAIKKAEGLVNLEVIENEEDAWINKVESWIQHNVSNCGFQYGDVALLFHTNDHASAFAQGLLERNIPVISDESLLLKNDPSVQLIISTIRAGLFDSEPFLLIHWLAKAEQLKKLQGNFHNLASEVKKLKRSTFDKTAQLAGISLRSDQFRKGHTYDQILIICRAFKLDEESAFIRKLLDFALEYEHGAKFLQKSFLNFWEQEMNGLSIDLSPQNAVRIMTIHKSKGLQFPIVILPLLGLNFGKVTHSSKWIDLSNQDLGLDTALIELNKLSDTPVEAELIQEQQQSFLDQLNALYVAFTRAEKKLYGLIKPSRKKEGLMDPEEMEVLTNLDGWDGDSASLTQGSDIRCS